MSSPATRLVGTMWGRVAILQSTGSTSQQQSVSYSIGTSQSLAISASLTLTMTTTVGVNIEVVSIQQQLSISASLGVDQTWSSDSSTTLTSTISCGPFISNQSTEDHSEFMGGMCAQYQMYASIAMKMPGVFTGDPKDPGVLDRFNVNRNLAITSTSPQGAQTTGDSQQPLGSLIPITTSASNGMKTPITVLPSITPWNN